MIWAVDVSLALLLVLLSGTCLLITAVGMPGNWGIVAIAAVAHWLIPDTWRSSVSTWLVGGIVVLALIGELIEMAASAVGVNRLGGSTRSSIFAVIGSIVGAITGMFVGTPVPVIGNLIMALLLSGAGAWAGAILAERSLGKDWDESYRIGNAAFWGRLAGTLGKTIVGGAMAAWLSIELLL